MVGERRLRGGRESLLFVCSEERKGRSRHLLNLKVSVFSFLYVEMSLAKILLGVSFGTIQILDLLRGFCGIFLKIWDSNHIFVILSFYWGVTY